MKSIFTFLILLTALASAASPFTPAELTREESEKLVTNAVKAEQMRIVRSLIAISIIEDIEEAENAAEAGIIQLRLSLQHPAPSDEEIAVAREKAKQQIILEIQGHEKNIAESNKKITRIKAALAAGEIIAQ